MDRQTLRDWVHRFNAEGPEGLCDRKAPGRSRRLDTAQLAELKARVEAGPEPTQDGVVRWRLADLCSWAEARFQVSYQERGMGKILRSLGFSRISARPVHPQADPERQAEFKKNPDYPLYSSSDDDPVGMRRGPCAGVGEALGERVELVAAVEDAMGRAARLEHDCCRRQTSGAPDASAERFEQIPTASLDPNSTLIAVIEMSQSSWLVAAIVPGIERHPLKKLEANEEALL